MPVRLAIWPALSLSARGRYRARVCAATYPAAGGRATGRRVAVRQSSPAACLPAKCLLTSHRCPQLHRTPAQWAKVTRFCVGGTEDPVGGASEGNAQQEPAKQHPHRRLAWLDGAARTLMSNYRRGWSRYSEFVPGAGEHRPARFYTRREAARLMGFPDWYSVDLSFGLACKRPRGEHKQAQERLSPAPPRDANRFYHQIGNAGKCWPPSCVF
jgi:site-specific DNA-cytosine methylase